MRAPENSTRDSSTSCCTPIGKSPRRARGLMSSPRFLSSSAARSAIRRQATTPIPFTGWAAEKNILGHAQFRRDAELLMHHADAGGQRVAGGAEMDLPLVDAHGSGIGRMHAGDDLHHRAFAGAVLAGETMDLAGVQGEVDIPKRLDAAKRLRNVGQFKQRHRGFDEDQMRNCSSIHSMPSALALVTTGPSVTMFLGMPAFAP